ncbi:MAG: CoA transferase [Acidobacteriota bacterium]|nr:CoA transferase [Acidobacteriota bacterium]MDE3107546.1 CoA transferase [Acidobacteriota bacterium]MDE3222498.1 CoA transferase [Acidobacteriota bacterium]
MRKETVSGLLAGVRVLDVTTVLAGPFAAYQLSLLGADVIKVEIPGEGDLAREMGDDRELASARMGASFLAQNAGKRSLTADLKSDGGRQVFTRLVETSDVLVENMRPGVLARLGFSYAELQRLNPKIVYCAVSGFGQTGPLAHRPAYDQIIQGLSGMCDVTGWPSDDPLRVGFPVCDTLGGFVAAMSISAALVRREREGVGAELDVSMLESAITAMGWVTSEHLISGRVATRHGNDNAASSPSGTFRTGDGLLNIAANTQRQFEAVCEVVGRTDLITDERFLTRELRKRFRGLLTGELELALSSKSAIDWEALLTEVNVPTGRVLSLGEALEQEQIRERSLVHEIPLDLAGHESISLLGSGVHVDGRALVPSSAPPRLGEHTEQILDELGFAAEEIAVLKHAGVV